MSRAPRVLLLCDQLSVAGGVERFVCALASHLAGEGLDVAVGSVDTPRVAVRYPLDPRVQVCVGDEARATRPAAPSHSQPWPGPLQRAVRAGQLLRAQWRIGRALNRIIEREQPDVIVLNGLTTACSVLLLQDRRWAARTICCDHNHFSARSALWQRMRRQLYPRVAALVSLTEADAAKFRALNPRTRVIYNATSLGADVPADVQAPVVLAVGRHVAQKGVDLLLEAWREVLRAVPEARLRVVGDGPLRACHEQQAQAMGLAAQIEWLAPTPQVERLYREAAVFVLPSRYEGMPLALLEAQALGVPSVAFDCPTGPAEILTADTGRLVPAGDIPGLSRALIELLTAPALRARMGRAAIARSRDVFSMATHQQCWTALVRAVAVQGVYGGAGGSA